MRKNMRSNLKIEARIIFLIFAGISLLIISTATFSKEDNKPELLLVTGEWGPFTSSKMPGGGIGTKIVTNVIRMMGYRPKIKFVPWKRCEKMVEDGEVWATFPYAKTEERAKRFHFSNRLFSNTPYFFYYNNEKMKKVQWKKIEDLKPYVLGGLRGYYHEKLFKVPGLKVRWLNNVDGMVDNLVKGNIELAPLSDIVFYHTLKKLKISSKKVGHLKKPVKETLTNHVMSSKTFTGGDKLLKKFNAELDKYVTTDEYKNMFK